VNLNRIFIGLGVIMAVIITSISCIKKDTPIVLPPKTGSTYLQINTGNKYDTTVYVSLENNTIVKKGLHNDWDLRFDASNNGFAVLMNGGKNTRAFNTHNSNINSVIVAPPINSATEWGYDAPSLLIDSAYLHNWQLPNGESKNEVYVLRQGASGNLAIYKILIKSVNATNYLIALDTITGTNPNIITIPKNDAYNFSYLSFKNGGTIVLFEPPKKDWDIEFTRYIHPFYNATPFIAYTVTGCLANPYNTLSAGDTTQSFEFGKFNLDQINKLPLSKNANAIGYNWKQLPDVMQNYITQPQYLYLIKTQNNKLYKLHFLDYYLNGEVGAPKFEFERLN
jgi:HmuY protein